MMNGRSINRTRLMKKILIILATAMMAFPVVAQQSGSAASEVRAAVEAFNGAYGGNRVEEYFSYYVDDAALYFYGERQSVSAYHEEWAETIGAGGRVAKNELSDIRVRVLAGGDAAVASYFVEYAMRAPDGTVATARAFESDVWQKIDGEWKIVSLHYSEIAPAE
jgi:ketosteroid isomerase-like protein